MKTKRPQVISLWPENKCVGETLHNHLMDWTSHGSVNLVEPVVTVSTFSPIAARILTCLCGASGHYQRSPCSEKKVKSDNQKLSQEQCAAKQTGWWSGQRNVDVWSFISGRRQRRRLMIEPPNGTTIGEATIYLSSFRPLFGGQ